MARSRSVLRGSQSLFSGTLNKPSCLRVRGFPGVAQRFQVVGITGDGIRVANDYAHNAEKLRAAISAAQAGAERVVAVLQPHGFGPACFLRPELRELLPCMLRPQDHFCYAEILRRWKRSRGTCRARCSPTISRRPSRAAMRLITSRWSRG